MMTDERLAELRRDAQGDSGFSLDECVEVIAEIDRCREEAAWIRRKLGLPEDCGFVTGDKTLAGEMHVVCSHAHGYVTYIEAFKCDDKQGEIARLTVELGKSVDTRAAIRAKLQEIVCTEDPDKGVVLLSQDGPCHTEVWGGKPVQVYDHEHFSPLGDALIELWELAQ